MTLANIWHCAAGFGTKAEARQLRARKSREQSFQSQAAKVLPQLVVDNTRHAIDRPSGSDTVPQVIADNFRFDAEGDMQASKAYTHYVTACVRLGLEPKSNNWFSAKLICLGLERVTRNGRRFYLGLAPVELAAARAA